MTSLDEIFKLIGDDITKKDKALLKKAYDFGEKAHSGQKRMSGEPYFVHAIETAKTLIRIGMDTQTIAAGLIHDVLEDTKVTEKEIRDEFGEDICFLVKGVTKLGTLKYRGRERYVESLRKFFIAMASDLRVVIIKFADRLHNLQTLEFVREDKRKRIAIESIEVYAPLANRLGMGKLKGEIEDAAFPYAYPKEYLQVEEIIKEQKGLYEKHLQEVKEDLEKELKRNKIKYIEIDYRVKHKYSLYKKLLKYDMDLTKIYDIVALRVVVDSVETCYRILGLVHAIWNPLPGRIKDYIALPKPNGYRSIHTSIFTGSGAIAEIQIRTKDMHVEASYGVAAHFVYKENKGKKDVSDQEQYRWIAELKELNKNTKDSNVLEQAKMDFFQNRIFVFTPEGDVLDLPEESCPIDFAYTIHSDIGNHVFGAKINGKMTQIFTKLKNGDIVEIVTKRDSHPSTKWLDCVKTTVARKHIRHYLEKNSLLSKFKSFGQK